MKLIVGLGNPGNEYNLTRHNIGFLATDYLADRHNIPFQDNKFMSSIGYGMLFGHKVIMAKPLTFMNRSGESVSALSDYFHIAIEDILIVHDDMDIEFGKLKIKTQGGSAGHRGIISVIKCLKTDNFLRIRLGIGKPCMETDASNFVLEKFNDDEQHQLEDFMQRMQQCLEVILTRGSDMAMNIFHA